ncbi:hypothetical protein PHET_01547 [Paragonimus heterotremus]|uniref:F-box domain-containing protein n=1 Tax=Paragonimus heterotremus TaxID=100268 RepID=A0A8J4WKC9_9TREM|nr:hypothetical protein PHET_01547 [Paragonimus heterotremus]
MDRLPNEILMRIFCYLDCEQLVDCGRVCSKWHQVASDYLLWRGRLNKLFSEEWSVIVYDRETADCPSLLDLLETNPRLFYCFFQKHIPTKVDSGTHSVTTDAENTSSDASKPCLLPSFVPHWWDEEARELLFRSTGGIQEGPEHEYRFAVFGSGLDRNAFTNMFALLQNGRVGPFEVLDIYPGQDGYGRGLTMRVHGYAQINALDNSMRPKRVYPQTTAEDCQSDEEASPRISSKRSHRQSRRKKGNLTKKQHSTTETNDNLETTNNGQPKALTFDLVLFYSNQNRNDEPDPDELHRIAHSRLFVNSPQQVPLRLKLRTEVLSIVRTINGFIYTIDTRISRPQLTYTYQELTAVLKSIAPTIPIVFLYISPEGETTASVSVHSNSWLEQNTTLYPLRHLGLFRISNPWRLQKCADNDLKAILQSVLWLRAHVPVCSRGQNATRMSHMLGPRL